MFPGLPVRTVNPGCDILPELLIQTVNPGCDIFPDLPLRTINRPSDKLPWMLRTGAALSPINESPTGQSTRPPARACESLPILGNFSVQPGLNGPHVDAAVERTSRHCSFVRASDRRSVSARISMGRWRQHPRTWTLLAAGAVLSRGDRGLSAGVWGFGSGSASRNAACSGFPAGDVPDDQP